MDGDELHPMLLDPTSIFRHASTEVVDLAIVT